MSTSPPPNPYDYLLDMPVRPLEPAAPSRFVPARPLLPFLCAFAAIGSWLYFFEPGKLINPEALQELIVVSDLTWARIGKMLVCGLAGWSLGGMIHAALQR